MNSSIKRHHAEFTNNKFQRPFSAEHALHVTMRSDVARGKESLLIPRTRQWLHEYVPSLARKLGVRLYCWSNNGNHLHLVLRADSRITFQRFLRTLASRVACVVLQSKKGREKNIRFWTKRPYSRVLSWGRELSNVLRYVSRNIKESFGQMSYVSRSNKERMRQTNASLDLKRAQEERQLSLRI